MTRHLVLAGAGHAQLDLLGALARGQPSGWTVTLVTPEPDFHYSGMLPGIIAGSLSADAARIPVAAIARAAGLQVRLASVTALDPGRRLLQLHDGSTVPFDLLSLDVGSAAAGRNVPGVLEHAFAMRPFGEALRLIARLDRVLRSPQHVGPIPVVVVGAGAAGVEIALAMRARILAAGREPSVTLVDAMATDGSPLPGFADTSRRDVRQDVATARCACIRRRRHGSPCGGGARGCARRHTSASIAGDGVGIRSCRAPVAR
jgi:NADH dehydrogenase FAD-containing subunit